jgi:glutamate dehydrogenase (NAD(P)+)
MTAVPGTVVVEAGSPGGALGFVCIDSTINGRARGGLRLMPDVSARELELLARAMTLKYGFLGLPQGGAKGGVVGNPDAGPDERTETLLRFARAAAPILASRVYTPDADMGTTGPDIQRMLAGIGVRLARREHRGTRSGLYTAATVFESARAAAAAQGVRVDAARVAIEGFGNVGGPLAGMFVQAGARVVAVSTRSGGVLNPGGLDIAALRARMLRDGEPAAFAGGRGDLGDFGELIEPAALKRLPVEIFCPCARHDSVGEDDAAAITARVVSCGANGPVTPAAEQRLWDLGILCVPDFVANAGGVLGGTMEFAGWRPGEILAFVGRRFGPRVASLVGEARRTGRPLRLVAEDIARERFNLVKRAAERRSRARRGVEAALAAYREGWVPGRVVRRLSAGYFRHCVS